MQRAIPLTLLLGVTSALAAAQSPTVTVTNIALPGSIPTTFTDLDAALNSIEDVSGAYLVELEPAAPPDDSFPAFNFTAGFATNHFITLRPRGFEAGVSEIKTRVEIDGGRSFVTGRGVFSTNFTIEGLDFDGTDESDGGVTFEAVNGRLARSTVQNALLTGVEAFGTGIDATCLLTVEDCVVKNCGDVSTDAGGVLVSGGSEVTLRRTLVKDNVASRGAGVFVADASSESNELDAIDCRFEGNRANGQGGAISVQDVASARFEDCLFSDNSVGELPDIQVGTLVGGALFSFLPTELEIDGCVFDNNRAVGAESFGGALHIAEVGSELSLLDRVTIEDSLFVRNSAPDGGAILSDNAVIELVRSTAADNVATDATGTSVYATNSINLSADACVFWNNIGAPFGGIPFLNACFGQGTNGIDPGFTTGRGASFPGMDSEDEDGTFTAAGGYYLGAGSLAVDFAGVFACPGSDDDVCARTTSLVESFDDNGLLDAGYHYQTPRLGLHTILAESDGAETVQATIGSTVDLEFRAGAPTTNHDPTVARGWAIVTSFAAGSTPSGPTSVPLGGAPQILSFGLFPVGDAAGLTALSVPVPMEPELVGVTIFASAVAIETWSAPPAYVTLGAGSQAGNLLDPNLMTIQFGL